MRQEKTLKVCCLVCLSVQFTALTPPGFAQIIVNHLVNAESELAPNAGSDRAWVWSAYDFSEGEVRCSLLLAPAAAPPKPRRNAGSKPLRQQGAWRSSG